MYGWERMQQPLLSGINLQRQTLRLYGELVARHESWAGKLVFTCGEGASATGLPAAVSIAGGTALVLDPDAAAVKAVFRQGGVDFVVNTLDEALRVLKNEIRKHRPLSVALKGDVQHILTEMAERGVLPDLQIVIIDGRIAAEVPTRPSPQQALQSLQENGIKSLHLQTDLHGMVIPSEEAADWLSQHGWNETLLPSDQAGNTVAARTTDAHIEMLPTSDHIRGNWIERISKYQRDARTTRLVWMTEKEQRNLALGKADSPG
jgi:Urocanase Rossmann-like domain